MLEIRHLKSLGKVLDTDILHPKVRADLELIYDHLKHELHTDKNRHFKYEELEED